MARIVTIVGSLSDPSKTRKLAEFVQSRVAEASGAETELIDVGALVADLAVRSRKEANPTLEQALRAVETADLIIAASPIYKGSYSGLFKHLIDLVDFHALKGVPVALLAVGGSDRHALAVEHQLRPLFAALNAATLPTGTFVSEAHLAGAEIEDLHTLSRLETLIDEAAAALAQRKPPAAVPQRSAA